MKLSAMGDVVHCLPLAARIKERLPNVELTWLVEAAPQDLLHGNPAVDRVLLFPRKSWLKGISKPGSIFSTVGAARKFFNELKAFKFDMAIDAQGLLKSALPAYWSGAPLRVGFAGTREGASKLLTHALEVGDYFGPDRHVVELNMALADFALETLAQERSTCLRLAGRDRVVHFPLPDPGDALRASVKAKLSPLLDASPSGAFARAEAPDAGSPEASLSAPEAGRSDSGAGSSNLNLGAPELGSDLSKGAPHAPLIALIPGTTWRTKIWPEESWITLGRMLHKRLGARLVICGGPGDREVNRSIYKGISSADSHQSKSGESNSPEYQSGELKDLTGETSLMELVALFEKCDVVLGADTGPIHLAAAVGHNAFISELLVREPKDLRETASRKTVHDFEFQSISIAKPKVVAVHGATPWKRNGPYGSMGSTVHLNLECQPCFEKTCRIKTLACLKDLPVEEVFKAVEKAMAKKTSL